MGRCILFRRNGTFAGPFMTEPCDLTIAHLLWRAYGTEPAELNRASLERGSEQNPQPDRVGFEQVMSLGARYLLEGKLAESKAP